jgi:CubicO group peptidase (beta-lactamase class C family)
MPGYGRTITIRHLLTHTSGLRDYIALMTLGGWQFEDLTTSAQALDVVRPQKHSTSRRAPSSPTATPDSSCRR